MPLQQRRSLSIALHTKTVRRTLLSLLAFFLVSGQSLTFAEASNRELPFQQTKQNSEGVFLVATKNLAGSSFQRAVILLTHNSKRGATGLTINRPAGISLKQAYPRIRELQQRSDPLFLGGPVNSNAIFVLLRTLQPSRAMHRIANDVYFSTGRNAYARSFDSSSNIATRTYAGYAGWAAGQLQNEIDRGDWLMVHTNPEIIFEDDTESLWQRLTRRWTGKWI